MEIILQFNGPVKRPFKENRKSIQLNDSATVADLLRWLGYSEMEQTFLIVAINSEKAMLQSCIREGDLCEITLLMGGG